MAMHLNFQQHDSASPYQQNEYSMQTTVKMEIKVEPPEFIEPELQQMNDCIDKTEPPVVPPEQILIKQEITDNEFDESADPEQILIKQEITDNEFDESADPLMCGSYHLECQLCKSYFVTYQSDSGYCGPCGVIFECETHLIINPKKCSLCGFTYSEKRFQRHMLERHPVRCSMCSSFVTGNPDELNDHLVRSHNCCYFCNNVFRGKLRRLRLGEHFWSHHSDEVSWKEIRKLSCSASYRYRCSDCFEFTSCHKGEMKKHRRTHRSPVYYRCDQCSVSVSNRSALARHKIVDHPRLKCELCNFATNNHLHMREHTKSAKHDNKTYDCTLCSFKDVDANLFAKHVADNHTNQKCPKCSFNCLNTTTLKAHIRKNHS